MTSMFWLAKVPSVLNFATEELFELRICLASSSNHQKRTQFRILNNAKNGVPGCKSKITVNSIHNFLPRIAAKAEIDACSILWCISCLDMKRVLYVWETMREKNLHCISKAALPL